MCHTFTSLQVGAKLQVVVDTTTSTPDSHTSVQLAYLKSYSNMGQARITCSGGCSCKSVYLDGHHQYRVSTVFLMHLQPSPAKYCEVNVEVLEGTRSEGHKFKVSGIMVSDVRGEPEHGKKNEALSK
jgi:hypothetical protein